MKLKAHVIVFLLLCLHISVWAQRIDVYLGMNDCVTCYSGLTVLEQMKGYEKNLIVTKEDSLVAAELMANYQLGPVRYNYVSHLKPALSYYKVFSGNKLLDSLPITALPAKVASYMQYDPAQETIPSTPLYLPANTIFNNDRLDIMVRNSKVLIYDYILNKSVLCSVEAGKDSLKKLLEIKGAQFPIRPFLMASRTDTTFYYKCTRLLKSMGKAHPHIEGSYLSDSSLFLFINFSYAQIETLANNVKDTAINLKFFLYERNFITGTKKLSLIDDSAMMKKTKDGYGVSNVYPFYVDAKTRQLFTSIVDYTDEARTRPVFFTTVHKDRHYEVTDFDKLAFDRDYYTKHGLDSFKIWINSRYYYNVRYDLLIDYKEHKILYLKNLNLTREIWGRDIRIDEKGRLHLLALNPKQNTLEIICYDLKQQKLLSHKTQPLLKDCSQNTVRFYDNSTVFFMSLNKPKGYFIKIADD